MFLNAYLQLEHGIIVNEKELDKIEDCRDEEPKIARFPSYCD